VWQITRSAVFNQEGGKMKKGVNLVFILGNVGQDPEIRRTASNDCCATVSVATSESWKDKANGEQKEVTEWHRIIFWRKLAEIVEQYVKKGSKIHVQGKLQTRSWEQDGVKRYVTEIIAEELQMLDGKPQSEHRQPPSQNQGRQPQKEEQNSFDDDIPF
jgi:single-strand DNA-binding protein